MAQESKGGGMTHRCHREPMLPKSAPTRCQGKIESAAKTHKVLQRLRRANAEQLAQQQAQIPCGNLNHIALPDFVQAAQPSPPRSTCLAHMSKAAFREFAPQTLQAFALGAAHAPTI